ncbi:MAG: glycine cleavage system aminomethyltransferase GcvT [Candidatus Omnitrophota bacterium]|jgi:aminomethyltransferase
MSGNDNSLKNTPLYKKHLGLGARMVPFSGWNMPVQYTGIIEEHLHTRAKAGLFDICHMGEFLLKGPTAEKDLNNLVTCHVGDMAAGKCRYGFMLNERGGIIDDLIVFKTSPEEFMLVVNAGTTSKDKQWIEANICPRTEFYDESGKIAKIDLQGPLSGDVMARLADRQTIEGIKRYYFTHAEISGARILVSRTGYTGELGYELFLPVEYTERIWEEILKFDEVKPVGLGARDTLRLEMGYSLYGSDIDEEHTPLEANLQKFIYWEKDFTGKEALVEQKKSGVKQVLTGFVCDGRRSARKGFEVIAGQKKIGKVTSAAFSPCMKKAIGLGYMEKDFINEGAEIALTDGKVEVDAFIKHIPVYER